MDDFNGFNNENTSGEDKYTEGTDFGNFSSENESSFTQETDNNQDVV